MVRLRMAVSRVLGLLVLGSVVVGPAVAHVGSIEAGTSQPPIPMWFVVLSAGVVVGSSFLFTSLMADHATLRLVNGLGLRTGLPARMASYAGTAGRIASVALLAVVVAVAFLGPANPQANAATLGVWVGWWAGYAMTTYLVGNSWPALNPFRTLAGLVPGDGAYDYPERLGVWPAVVGVLALVYLEVATAASSAPRLLGALVVAYAGVTLAGVALVGSERWFASVDPVAAVFRTYGRLAPIQRTDDGLGLRLPGAALTDPGVRRTPGWPAFVVALLWATTFDGLVSTPAFAAVAGPVVDVGVPPAVVFLVVLGAGFALFYRVYREAARRSRDSADSFVTGRAIERWFAPSLIPIAAGYHFAHFVGYVVSLAPAVIEAVRAPFAAPAAITVVALPDWFGLLQLGVVILGHLLAIWVAHSIAFDLFPGARQPIRSQYPMILVMIGYTVVSAWVIVSPATGVVA